MSVSVCLCACVTLSVCLCVCLTLILYTSWTRSVCVPPQEKEHETARAEEKQRRKDEQTRRRKRGQQATSRRRARQRLHRKAKTDLSNKLGGKIHNMTDRTYALQQSFVGLPKTEIVKQLNGELMKNPKTTGYEIRETEDAGWSVFVSKDLDKGARISLYEGEFRRGLPGGADDRAVELKGLHEQTGTYDTFLHGSLACLGTWLNDARGAESSNNTKLVEDAEVVPSEAGAVWVQTVKAIKASRDNPVELLLHYGDEYWRVVDELQDAHEDDDNSDSQFTESDCVSEESDSSSESGSLSEVSSLSHLSLTFHTRDCHIPSFQATTKKKKKKKKKKKTTRKKKKNKKNKKKKKREKEKEKEEEEEEKEKEKYPKFQPPERFPDQSDLEYEAEYAEKLEEHKAEADRANAKENKEKEKEKDKKEEEEKSKEDKVEKEAGTAETTEQEAEHANKVSAVTPITRTTSLLTGPKGLCHVCLGILYHGVVHTCGPVPAAREPTHKEQGRPWCVKCSGTPVSGSGQLKKHVVTWVKYRYLCADCQELTREGVEVQEEAEEVEKEEKEEKDKEAEKEKEADTAETSAEQTDKVAPSVHLCPSTLNLTSHLPSPRRRRRWRRRLRRRLQRRQRSR